MKKADRSKLFEGVQQMLALIHHMRGEAHRYPFENGKKDLKKLMDELPKGKQFKAYNDRIKSAVEECQNGYGLTLAYSELSQILLELL